MLFVFLSETHADSILLLTIIPLGVYLTDHYH